MAVLQSFHEPGVWLVISVLCGVALVAGWPFTPRSWRVWVALVYWVSFPYLALVSGAVSPRLMGVRYIDWSASFRVGAGLLLVLVLLAAMVRLLTIAVPRGASPTAEAVGGLGPGTLAVIGLCGAEEFFWSFLRGAFWEIALSVPLQVEVPAYWAVWAAALVALPMAVVMQPSTPRRLAKLTVLIVTSVVFFYTRNFWLCWFLHAAVWLVLLPIADRELRTDVVNSVDP